MLLIPTHYTTVVFLCLLCLCPLAEQAVAVDVSADPIADEKPEPVVVAYLPDYRVGSIDPDTLWIEPVTDLIYFSLTIPADGVFDPKAINTDHLNVLKKLQKKAGCRLLLCVGGWGRSDGFPETASDETRRKKLIQSLLKLCKVHGFDGIDYDWEHPANAQQKTDYGLLIQATAKQFAEHDLIITVAQAGWQNLGEQAYQALDRVHLMCYDNAFPHATMRHAEREVNQLIKWGCSKRKIAVGIPFYGRDQAGRVQAYGQLVKDRIVEASDDRVDGYAFNGIETVAKKMGYALDNRLAGVMVWEITQDQPETQPLLRAIGEQVKAAHD